MDSMDNKIALITGGAQGLGRAFAEILLENGAKVCLADIDDTLGDRTVQEFCRRFGTDRAIYTHCDVTSDRQYEGAFRETIRKFGRVDILLNNAGIVDETDWQRMIGINMTAVIRGTVLGFKYMGKAAGQTDGVIVNTSSVAGFVPVTFLPVYTAVKHGVLGYTRSVGALSPKEHGVRVNCLCPYIADTALGWNIPREAVGLDKGHAFNMITKWNPLKPRVVAEGLYRLLCNKSASGEAFVVSPNIADVAKLPSKILDAFPNKSKI